MVRLTLCDCGCFRRAVASAEEQGGYQEAGGPPLGDSAGKPDGAIGSKLAQLRSGAKAVVAQQRMANSILPPKPPRRLATTLMVLPDREKYPAYYDIVQTPIDMEMIKHKAEYGSYPSVFSFRQDMQTMLFNARVTAGRGTQLWEDLTKIEALICTALESAGSRLPYQQDDWPKWNTIPPELYIKDANSAALCTVMYLVTDTVGDVKDKMRTAKKDPLQSDGHRLIFKGQELQDDVTMADAGIEAGTTIRNEPWIRVQGALINGEAAVDGEAAVVQVPYSGAETALMLLRRLQKGGLAQTEGQQLRTADSTDSTPTVLSRTEVELEFESEPSFADAGVLPGDTLVMEPTPAPEVPEEEQHAAATVIQAVARGRRARRAVEYIYTTRTGAVNLALFRTVMEDDPETLSLLLQHGGDREARNPAGHSLLELAAERGRHRVRAWLKGEADEIDSNEEDFAEEIDEEGVSRPSSAAGSMARIGDANHSVAGSRAASEISHNDSSDLAGLDISSMMLPKSSMVSSSRRITRAEAVREELTRLRSRMGESRLISSSRPSSAAEGHQAWGAAADDSELRQQLHEKAWLTGRWHPPDTRHQSAVSFLARTPACVR